MVPQRKTAAGPMAPSSMKASKKSIAVSSTKSNVPEKEVITVHTSTPSVEKRSARAEQSQIYQGEYTEDLNDIAAGFTDGTIRLFNCSTGICSHSLVDDECRAYPGPVTAIKHRPVSKAAPITNILLSSC
ncbi:Ribosome biogenesis protein YTM1 [Operophtera brumata]|uniref:Ribosome biogenesis protein YTM1 n=1 Tax=Operophtera brumata TaxID=104452 RepID=A0A0L7KS17_OPEBR|nr:Ribosome biogenesis protein YTM1 [Operophtera brumata]